MRPKLTNTGNHEPPTLAPQPSLTEAGIILAAWEHPDRKQLEPQSPDWELRTGDA